MIITFQYQKSRKEIEVLSDLVKIHNDRIAGYQQALAQYATPDADLKELFETTISESEHFQEQLLRKINQLNGDTRLRTPIFGKIYRAWTDLKVAFSGNTRKAIISSCLYNEEIALHTYRAALNANIDISDSSRKLIEHHETALKAVYQKIKTYKEYRYTADYTLLYSI